MSASWSSCFFAGVCLLACAVDALCAARQVAGAVAIPKVVTTRSAVLIVERRNEERALENVFCVVMGSSCVVLVSREELRITQVFLFWNSKH